MLKISVITPSYNQAEYLKRAMDSVLGQEGDFELEYIVMDGGSTDGSVDILKGYGDRVTWVSRKDEGQADALNKGIAMATGDVIGWLNSDDLYEPGALAAVAKVFRDEPQTQWLYGKVRIIDPDDHERRRWVTAYKNRRMKRYSYAKLVVENYISQMGVFWRAGAGREVGPLRKELHFCMDYDYWLRLGRRWPGRFVDRYLGAFRWYPASKSGAHYDEEFREGFEVAKANAADRFPSAVRRHRLNSLAIVAVYRLLQLGRWLQGLLRR